MRIFTPRMSVDLVKSLTKALAVNYIQVRWVVKVLLYTRLTSSGRSRNDQVATDMRLWLREELRKLKDYLQEFLKATADRAEKEIDHLCPGIPRVTRLAEG